MVDEVKSTDVKETPKIKLEPRKPFKVVADDKPLEVKADEPVLSEQTLLEMEAGRKARDRMRPQAKPAAE